MFLPIPIELVSATYCILTLRAFLRQRQEFAALMDQNPNLSFGRYFRLMALAALNAFVTVPLAVWVLVTNLRSGPMSPWRGLGHLHSGFSRVDEITETQWRSDPQSVEVVNFRLWIPIATALVFFAFFGLAEEARKHYRLLVAFVARKLGFAVSSG